MGGKQWAWSLVAAVPLVGLTMGAAQQSGSNPPPDGPVAQQQGVPDAPGASPSQNANDLKNLTRQVAPGKASAPESDGSQVQAPPPPQRSAPNPDGEPQQEAPY
ncbi:MAG TPA: hypothetical protein VGJ21_14170, partial [Terracidiphilus sp.]